METLFTTDLVIDGKMETFSVTFQNDQYLFKGLHSNTSFTVRREEDEWHVAEKISESVKTEATEKLDSYLLSQH